MKKLLVALMIFAFACPVFAGPFSDMPITHWAFDAVKKLTDAGIMSGMPDGTFQGEKKVTRYEVAVVLARTLDALEGLKVAGKVTPEDIRTLEKLTVEFADELALLGVKVTALEDEVQMIRDDIAVVKSDVAAAKRGGGGGNGKILVTGDAWIRLDQLKFENDTVDPDNDWTNIYEIGLNMSAEIDEDISTFMRLTNYDVDADWAAPTFGAGINNMPFDIFLAYVDVKKFFDLGDVRVGRQFISVGHNMALAARGDGIKFCKKVDKLDVTLLAIDDANANGFNMTGLILGTNLDKHDASFYYLKDGIDVAAPGVDSDPTIMGLTLDGDLVDKCTYIAEYAKFDPDVAGGVKGSALLAGINWEFTEKLDVTINFGKGDEEYNPFAIGYWARYNDMFGRMDHGNADGKAAAGTAIGATGSLVGIKDTFIKLNAELSEKTDGALIYEKVEANDSSTTIANAEEYKRICVRLSHQYAPNTAFGLQYDTVEYDVSANDKAADSGGWSRIRVDMNVKF